MSFEELDAQVGEAAQRYHTLMKAAKQFGFKKDAADVQALLAELQSLSKEIERTFAANDAAQVSEEHLQALLDRFNSILPLVLAGINTPGLQ